MSVHAGTAECTSLRAQRAYTAIAWGVGFEVGPDSHRLDRASFAWRTHSITSSARAPQCASGRTPRPLATVVAKRPSERVAPFHFKEDIALAAVIVALATASAVDSASPYPRSDGSAVAIF